MSNSLDVSALKTTMTSREIAELTGKQHKNVLRDIEKMLVDLEANSKSLNLLESSNLSSGIKSSTYRIEGQNREYPQYELDYDSTICLIAGYSAILRMRVIKRWQELEAMVADQKEQFPVPKTFSEALKLAYDQQIKIEQLEFKTEQLKVKTEQLKVKTELLKVKIELDRPKIEFINSITPEISNLTISDYAKLLSEKDKIIIGPNKLFKYLRFAGYLMIGKGASEWNKPYQKHIQDGNFLIKYVDTKIGTKGQTLITLKGQIELTKEILTYFSK